MIEESKCCKVVEKECLCLDCGEMFEMKSDNNGRYADVIDCEKCDRTVLSCCDGTVKEAPEKKHPSPKFCGVCQALKDEGGMCKCNRPVIPTPKP